MPFVTALFNNNRYSGLWGRRIEETHALHRLRISDLCCRACHLIRDRQPVSERHRNITSRIQLHSRSLGVSGVPSRRFPPPWTVEEQSACYPLLGLTSADTATARVYDSGAGTGRPRFP